MNSIQNAWETVSPYIMGFVNILLTGGLGAFLARLLASRWLKKQDVNTLLEGLAKRLSGSKINLDLTAVTEKKLAEIGQNLAKQIAAGEERNALILQCVGDILDSIKASAKLSDEKRAKLLADLETVKNTSAPQERKEEITVTLDTAEKEKAESRPASLVNFD